MLNENIWSSEYETWIIVLRGHMRADQLTIK